MKRLSIIVPFYNVEAYIERCLISLVVQDISEDEYEIICINDGSSDKSAEIVENLQKEFANIVLIDQKNQGVSRARNNGIKMAKGRYLLFIDSDDYVDVNSLYRILENADKREAEVSFLGLTHRSIDNVVLSTSLIDINFDDIYLGIKAYYLARGVGISDPDRMCGVLFEREFILKHKLFYLDEVSFLEDGELIARILSLASSCIFDGNSFYQRTNRPGSATQSKAFRSKKAAKGFLLAAVNLKRFQGMEELSDQSRIFLNQPICKYTALAIQNSIRKPYLLSYKTIRKQLSNDGIEKLERMGVAKSYIKFVHIYNHFPFVFLIIEYCYMLNWTLKRLWK
jgi:glycosyltransferase involved in cell wall biosynthesis